MKQTTQKKIPLLLIVFVAYTVVVPVFLYAQEEEPPPTGEPPAEEELPPTIEEPTSKGVILLEKSLLEGFGFEEGVVEQGQLGQYLNALFLLGIGVASGLAVIYITVGGIQYMVSASLGKKEAGREKILGAVGGLVLALASFAILNTINPDLLEFNIEKAIQNITNELPEQQQKELGLPWHVLEGLWAREQLKIHTNDRVTLNRPNECTIIGESGCTSIALINENFYTAARSLADVSGCNYIITGGTEYWLHGNGNRSTEINLNPTRHKPGNGVVDLGSTVCINTYIMDDTPEDPNNSIPNPHSLGCPPEGFAIVERDGWTFQWEPAECHGSSGDHWHVDLLDVKLF